jgi:hypothetical protein
MIKNLRVGVGKGAVLWITDGADGNCAVSPFLLVYTRLILHLRISGLTLSRSF